MPECRYVTQSKVPLFGFLNIQQTYSNAKDKQTKYTNINYLDQSIHLFFTIESKSVGLSRQLHFYHRFLLQIPTQ